MFVKSHFLQRATGAGQICRRVFYFANQNMDVFLPDKE